MSTVSQPEHRRTLSETDWTFVRYLAAKGNGYEDIFVKLGGRDTIFYDDAQEIKSIVLKRTTAPAAGAATGAVFPQGHRRGT
jgi:hypothetical protein